MNLVYNNDKPIGKCESYSIDKVPGTRPLVMLTNFEPKYSELNENQQIVLDWLEWSVKEQRNSPMDAVYLLVLGESLDSVSLAYIALTPDQQTQVLAAFAEWGVAD